MAQFDVYENRNTKTRPLIPFLLEVQSDLLAGLATTVVIPMSLVTETKALEMARLTPRINIEERHYLLLTPQLAGISRKELGDFIVNAASYRDDIIGALDFLITGI